MTPARPVRKPEIVPAAEPPTEPAVVIAAEPPLHLLDPGAPAAEAEPPAADIPAPTRITPVVRPAEGAEDAAQAGLARNIEIEDADEPAEPADAIDGEVDVTYRQALGGATLIVPFKTPPRAAVFHRGGALWLIFDENVNLDVSADDRMSLIESVVQLPHEVATVVRVKTAPDFHPVARRTETAWEISLKSNTLTPVAPLDLAVDRSSRARAVIVAPDGGTPVRIHDPAVGDALWVVPLAEPGTGFDRGHDYADFGVLPTAQGIAIEVRCDGLRVRNEAGSIEITTDDGLRLANESDHARAMDGRAFDAIASRLLGAAGRRTVEAEFTDARQALLQTIVNAEGDELVAARMQLSQLFLANGFAADALGTLAAALREAPGLERDADFIALRGASRQFFGDYQGAAEDLQNPAVGVYPELDLWRGALAAASADWQRATLAFSRAHHFLTRYPPPVRRRLLFLAVDAALHSEDPASASTHVAALDSLELNGLERDRLLVLRGRLRALEGDDENALLLLNRAAASTDHRARAEAEFARIDLLLQLDQIVPDDAIERLERLSYVWRGDEFEFAVLQRLGDQQFAQENYRDGLLSLRRAVSNFPDHSQSGEVTRTMTEAFQHLYLNGGADTLSPVTAIALLDAFRELTPAGPDGDRMVRELTDRLVAVDLLGKAAELLEHQIEFRSAGADKADIGAQLAAIYLLDHNPEAAAAALEKSAQPNLPPDMVAERGRLAARAEFARQNDAQALALLANDTTADA